MTLSKDSYRGLTERMFLTIYLHPVLRLVLLHFFSIKPFIFMCLRQVSAFRLARLLSILLRAGLFAVWLISILLCIMIIIIIIIIIIIVVIIIIIIMSHRRGLVVSDNGYHSMVWGSNPSDDSKL